VGTLTLCFTCCIKPEEEEWAHTPPPPATYLLGYIHGKRTRPTNPLSLYSPTQPAEVSCQAPGMETQSYRKVRCAITD
jgi:hypothetical protein